MNVFYSKKKQWIGVIFLSIVFFGLLYWVLINPKVNFFTTLCLQEKTLRMNFENMHYQGSSIAEYRKQVDALQDEIQKWQIRVKKTNKTASWLAVLAAVEKTKNLRLQAFVPRKAKQHRFYRELTFDLTLNGTYSQIHHFFHQLNQIPQMTFVRNFVIEKVKEEKVIIKMVIATVQWTQP